MVLRGNCLGHGRVFHSPFRHLKGTVADPTWRESINRAAYKEPRPKRRQIVLAWIKIVNFIKFIFKGFLALYNGLSASVLRQLTYSTTRFAIYDTVKIIMGKDSTFGAKVAVAAFAGAAGGFIGTPADKVNVRMQNDVKLPKDKRLK